MSKTIAVVMFTAVILATISPVRAQQPKKVPRIGYLSSSDSASENKPKGVESALSSLMITAGIGAKSLPHRAGQYISTSDWHDYAFAVVGLAYYASTLLLSSILFLTLAGSALSALRRS